MPRILKYTIDIHRSTAVKEAMIYTYRINDICMYDIDFPLFSSDRMPFSPDLKHYIMELENVILKYNQPLTTFWIRIR